MASRLVDFYHYTDESSAQEIQRTGHIWPSQASGPDAVLGTGVYGTKVPPHAGKGQIARNNWDGTGNWHARRAGGSVDYVFHLRIPLNNLREVKTHNGRQMYLHRNPIRLADYDYNIIEVP
ncbi:hypothetical protein C0Q70_20526 [Pomacea canaliculata]|uniref:Tox-ART-HYD1 domain-containing protein n=1 Tax=Pomacea canaliculata TaxID=400727 RepID=A0A2T7NFX4_POMCA|nr:uncharacterized protein LOC112554607 [Pomacea canaliculata]PVD20032.1 hypothetical protein C0Q70_20526 [Pomacea canaliculata]